VQRPFGTWHSPLPAAAIASQGLRLGSVAIDGGDIYWIEGRPAEGGRNVLVCQRPDGSINDMTPPPFNVRTRVHEYGGGAYVVSRGVVYFSNYSDQRMYRLAGSSGQNPVCVAITPPGERFYADCIIDEGRRRLVGVREDHDGAGTTAGAGAGSAKEPVNALVSIPLDGGEHPGDVIASGYDFYSTPRLSPDGLRLSWLAWRHPQMPWDGTELWVADVTESGALANAARVAGGETESIYQPGWSPDGALYYVSDRAGWWTLYRSDRSDRSGRSDRSTRSNRSDRSLRSGRSLRSSDRSLDGANDANDVNGPNGPNDWNDPNDSNEPNAPNDTPVLRHPPDRSEFGRPQWVFGAATWAFAGPSRIAAAYTQRGRWHLAVIDAATGSWRRVETDLEPQEWLVATGSEAVLVAASATRLSAVVRVNLESDSVEIVRESANVELDPADISVAEATDFPTVDGRTAHAFYYPPRNGQYVAPPGERPPVIAIGHGGPTTATTGTLDLRIQFWTTRGFGVVDVNYGGSSGYGREYRERLKGQWGVVDVADMVASVRHLVAEGRADPLRLMIRGGSAGGYTALAALTFHPGVFTAAASYYGISDIEVLARDTHKFESRYLDSLIGPYPAMRDLYRARSPIHHIDRLSCPLILFQGLEDKVVPPNQSQMMADAVRTRKLPVAYLTFEGEQHGFRKAETIVRSLEAELYFYGVVLGFAPADPLQPVRIDNPPAPGRGQSGT
jgi:acetyl esterase/lipase